MSNISKEIILCPNCKGKGILDHEVRINEDDWELTALKCSDCVGSGRLIKTTIVEPFK